MASDLAAATAEYRAAQQAVVDAKAARTAAQQRLERARDALAESIIADYQTGTRMRELTDETKLSREWIRTILRNAGIDPH